MSPVKQVIDPDEFTRITQTVSGVCIPDDGHTYGHWCARHNSYWTSTRGCNRFLEHEDTVERVIAELGMTVVRP